MNDFEKELNDYRTKNVHDINEDEFLYKLEMRVRHSKDNRKTILSSMMMLVAVLTLTITQYGAPDNAEPIYTVNDVANMLETDFWNISSDSLLYDESYFNDMAYYLLEEGYVWETYELMNEFEQEEEI